MLDDRAPTPPHIHVHIDRLIVRGVDVRDGPALGAAVQHEITRLFTERGWPNAPTEAVEAGRVAAEPVPLSARVDATDFGARVGAVVHGSLVR